MDGLELRADCERCVGLCCVALPFTASADFAFDKEAGEPCRNLTADLRCGIHSRLRESGFRGCVSFDCFGAGQKVSQAFGELDWREGPEAARQLFDAFSVMRGLHELLWYLTEALAVVEADPVGEDLRRVLAEIRRLTDGTADALTGLDLAALRRDAGPLLRRASELARADVLGPRADHADADLAGADLAGTDLRGATLRGACLIAADLRRADLRRADLLGADLRDANLSGADLGGSIFLTQLQVAAARGDRATVLPGSLDRPAHWRG